MNEDVGIVADDVRIAVATVGPACRTGRITFDVELGAIVTGSGSEPARPLHRSGIHDRFVASIAKLVSIALEDDDVLGLDARALETLDHFDEHGRTGNGADDR